MNDTFIYEDADAIVKNRAIGYVDEGNGFRREHFFNSTVTGDDGVYSTIDDLFKWSENFKSSKIGSATFIDKMLATEPLNDGSPQTYAGGLILGDYLPGLYSIGHSGEWGGFRSLFFKFPEQDATFIILSNNGNLNPWAILRPMVDVVLEDEIANIEAPSVETESRPSTERANFKMSQKSLKDYVGHYYNFLDGYSREIKMERDTLIYLRPDGRATKLIPTGKSNFVFMGATNVSVRFKNEKAPSLSIVLNIPGQSPIALSKYRPKQYTDTELEKFEGIYFSEELDVKYHLKVNGNSLAINVNGDILETVSSVMENVFDAPHFGYLKFNENADGTIDSFTINDELRRNILFLKLVNDETQKLN